MHIGLLSPAWPLGAMPNGIVTYVHHMRRGLLGLGHRVTVFAADVAAGGDDPAVQRIAPPPLVTRALRRVTGRPATVFDADASIAAAMRAVHARDPLDIVEMEETFGLAGGVARRLGVPLVVKLHGPAFLHPAQEMQGEFARRRIAAEGAALATLPAITAPSRWTLRRTVEHYVLRPAIAETIANPIEASPDAPPWHVDRCDPRLLLFVGRFDLVKGGDLVLLAYRRLLERYPGLRLAFVGPDLGLAAADGSRLSLDAYVRSLACAELAAGLRILGPLDPVAVEAMRGKAIVTVVASRQESQGYTAVEAMLCGCPLVCTDTSGLAELVEHGVTGLKARSEDPDSLAEQIGRILDAPALGASLGAAARLDAIARHSPAALAEQTVAVYRRAIELRARAV